MSGERGDLGWTHVALPATDLDASLAFYRDYAGLRVVHDRATRDPNVRRVLWLSDRTRPFVLVLLGMPEVGAPLGIPAHLGIAVASRAAVDALAERARIEGRLALAPRDDGPPAGYWCLVRDPDGHMVEFAFGQEVALAVERGC